MRLETLDWLSDLVLQMRNEADELQGEDTLDVRKYYSIYCVDTLQDALTRCVDYHLGLIYDEVDRISDELGKEFALDSSKLAKQNFRFVLHNKTWTKGDNVYLGSQMVSALAGVGGLLSLVTSGIAGHIRNKELAGQRDTVLQDIQEQFTQLESSLPQILKQHYDQIEKELNGQIQEFFANQIQTVEANTAQMVNVASRNEEEKQLIHQAICEVRAMLEEMAS